MSRHPKRRPRSRGSRGRGALPVVLIGALALAACAPATDAAWRPAAFPAARVAVGEFPAAIDPAAVPALRPVRIRNDEVGIQARVALLPGQTPLGDRVIGAVREAIGGREAATGVAYTPQVQARGAGLGDRRCVAESTRLPAADLLADPRLGPANGSGTAVACDIVVAAGPYLGMRVRTVSGDGTAISADTSATLYTDLRTGETVSADALWTLEAGPALWGDIVEALRRDAGALSLAPVQPPDEAGLAVIGAALARSVPAAGTVVVEVPAGFSPPELQALGIAATTEPMAVSVPLDVATPYLTPFGAGLAGAVASALPYEAPATIPAGAETIDCELVPCVALTYDDGPSPYTAGILDELKARDAAATFYVLGQLSRPYADALRRMRDEGHEIANHTWNHPSLPSLTDEQVAAQLRDTSAAIQSVVGTRPTSFRPPYGEYDQNVLRIAGLPAILWDVDTFDYQRPEIDTLIARAVDAPRPGSIVLMHDIHPGTAAAAAATYDGLLDRGFSLVTVTQIFEGDMPASGAWTSGR
ncbi:polysaccharide deacetylase family protein [Microbacterium sp. ET2]|uniref:polysaccharide deacetylase family protein n=1 Tax=Microbacterium albipurpureum TaxID=3050384 RepID=UPI00259CB729|nr:polysaccharide deacetylase family protein [Microbacterium sp. ET2 (Ac-2212)]WJL94986.1 polysaccharide deacetylase family protein [Microbacterium sp. ET2 (Ac-2212)]